MNTTRSRDIRSVLSDAEAPEIVIKPHATLELHEANCINLPESKTEIHQDVIERHVVPTVTEIHEQKEIDIIERPIVRKIIEKPIVREVLFTDEDEIFMNKQKDLDNFRTDLLIKKASLHSIRPFANADFRSEIEQGRRLRTARPFSRTSFPGELQAQKKMLTKSRYFSKDQFIVDFMAQKKLLKSTNESMYSRELSELGHWKGDGFLATTGDFFMHAYETVQDKVHQWYGK